MAHSTVLFRLHRTLLLAVSLLVPLPVWAAPGEADGRWSSLEIGGEIATAAANQYQGIWVAGDINLQLSSLKSYLLHFLPTGSVDSSMSRNQPGPISAMRLLPDSSILVATNALYALHRHFSDGRVDSNFSAAVTGVINAIGIGADKSILLGQSAPSALRRFNPAGTEDSSYAPALPATIYAISIQPDGSCYAGGVTLDGSGLLARISPTGVRDPAFTPDFDGPVLALAVDLNGEILAGGRFRQVNGSLRPALVRLLPDGSTDPVYQANPDGPPDALEIKTLLPQADGAVLVSGSFTAMNGTSRPGMARLSADGVLDPGFSSPDAERYGHEVKLLGLLPDGRVLADVAGSTGNRRILLLQNNPGTSSLEMTAPGEITWTRRGALPAVAQAWFEISQSGSGPWTDLGQAERTESGWKLTNPGLPTAGIVRAVGAGPAAGGESAGSLVSDSLSLDSPVHSFIVLRQDVAVPPFPVSSTAIDFGEVWQGSPASIPLVLRNTGTGTLTFSFDGPQASEFAVLPVPGTTLAPGDSTEFTITFTPADSEFHEAAMTITSDPPSAAPVTITLSGSGSIQRHITLDTLDRPAQRAESFIADGLSLTGLTINSLPPAPGGPDLMLVNNLSSNPIQGILTGLPQGSVQEFSTFRGPRFYKVDYFGGDGNDLVLHPVVFGSVDSGFQPRLDSSATVESCLRLRNGGILISGLFKFVGSKSRQTLVRLLPDGSLDETFRPVLPYSVYLSLTETESGKILLHSIDTAPQLLRMHLDGTLDAGFSFRTDGFLDGILPLPGERTLVVGSFLQVNGIPRNRIALLNADSSVDSTFSPEVNGRIFSVIALPDGRFLIGGLFTEINSVPRSGIARLNSDGSLDATFSATLPYPAYSLARQQDGRILCSYFAPGQIVRLMENGGIDSSFTSTPQLAATPVTCLSIQSNGKILVGIGRGSASFSSLKFGLLRLNANGSTDSNFDLPLAAKDRFSDIQIRSLCMGGDGTLLVGGSFVKAGGIDRQSMVRIRLEDPVQSLTIPSASRIQWLRGGSLPETSRISFALHDPTARSWISLGPGTPIPGGWEMTGLSLPADGAIRATAYPGGGRTNSSHSYTDTVVSFGNVLPDISLRRTDGTALTNSTGVLSMGIAPVFIGKSFPLVLENHGSAPLHSLAATLEGPDAAAFSAPLLPEDLSAGQTLLLPVRFTPTSTRDYTARLILSSNDPDEPSYSIHLTGTGGTPVQVWRDDYFHTFADEGSAASQADPDLDGLTNLSEYALGFDPLQSDSWRQAGPVSVNGFLELRLTLPPGRTDIRYTAEITADPAASGWQTVPSTGTAAAPLFRIPQTQARQFMRYRFILE